MKDLLAASVTGRAVAFAAVVTLCGIGAAARPAKAQLSAGFAVGRFQFNLSNPGARSLAMGGAFAGLADDATAAYANPAGLTILSRPEYSFEGRLAKLALPLVSAEPVLAGRTLTIQDRGEVTFQQLVHRGLVEAASLGAPDASGSTASFTSVVHPTRHWAFALYRHQLVDLDAAGGRALPPLQIELTRTDDQGTVTTATASIEALTQANVAVDISSLGFSAARSFGDRLSLGVTLVRNRAATRVRRTGESLETRLLTAGQAVSNSVESHESDITFNAGLLVRPSETWTVGFVYRQGPDFRVDELETVSFSEAIASFPSSSERFSLQRFDVPDVVGIGTSVLVNPNLLFAFEVSRVGYSKLWLPSRLPRALSYFASEEIAALGGVELADLGRFEITDVDELRAGFEYSFWQARAAPALRLGVWLDPDHQVRFESTTRCPGSSSVRPGGQSCNIELTNETGPLPLDSARDAISGVGRATIAEALASMFPAGKDRLHLTGGAGVVLGSRFQVDAAFDYVSSQQYTLSLSGVVRF